MRPQFVRDGGRCVKTCLWVLALFPLVGCSPAVKDIKPALGAQDSGKVWFSPDGKTVLSGDLTIPSGAGPFPAVVIAHGCEGVSPVNTGWVASLGAAGYATFVVDSLSGRGIREVCSNLRAVPSVQRTADVYAGLKILATHPRIDKTRIALIGNSSGGFVVLIAATIWARNRYAPPAGPRFRAFLSFYPFCGQIFPELFEISAPLRIHVGALDDSTPVKPCNDLVQRMKSAGQDAEIIVYPGAHHDFDWIGRLPAYAPAAPNLSNCHFELPSIEIWQAGTGLSAADLERCGRRGATSGVNAAALEQARKNVTTELSEFLR